MRSLVTGGLGFLGSSLTAQLLACGDEVDVVDDFSSSVVGTDCFSASARFRHFAADIVGFVPPSVDYDRIFHLASPVGAAAILDRAGHLGKLIVDQTAAIIEVAIRARASLVLVSSSEVYGDTRQQAEVSGCVVPSANTVRLEYGLGKRLAEAMVENRMREAGLPYSIVRPFNLAGPRQQPDGGFVIPTFIRQAIRGEALTVFGDGSQRRAFAHVDDVAKGIIRAAGVEGRSMVFNFGCPENGTTILDLARLIIRLCDSLSDIERVDPATIHGPRYADAFDRYPEVSRARELLDWHTHRTLPDILEEIIAHARIQAMPSEAGMAQDVRVS